MIKKYIVRDEGTRWLATALVLDDNLVVMHGPGFHLYGYVFHGPPSMNNVLDKVARCSEKQAADNFASRVTRGNKPEARQFIERVWPYFAAMVQREIAAMKEVRP